ncbi:adenine phosphoribosyltransferase [bacterium]|nr:adenine phosphoribosyltransferase [bacterium]
MGGTDFGKYVKDVVNFPREGIVFKDITPLLENPEAFHSLILEMAEFVSPEVTKIVSVESRGFILGAALAFHCKKGLVLCRKPGKLPGDTHSETYQLEYGQDSLEVHKTSLSKEDKVLIVDDVLATGGTAAAASHLCEKAGAKVLGLQFLIELDFLNGRQKLSDYKIKSLLKF